MATPHELSDMRVLVVDDNQDVADSLADVLRLELGCSVFTAYDGQTALRRAMACRPHAIVLDIGMPHMGGLEVARVFRLSRSSEAPPLLLAVTGRADVVGDLEAIDSSFDRAFAKPLNLDDLVATLRRHWDGQPVHAERTRFELAELFTRAVREVMPAVLAKRESASFDYSGPSLVLNADAIALHSAFYRLLYGLVDVMGAGFTLFAARATPQPDGDYLVEVNAAGAADLVSPSCTDDVLARLGLTDEPRQQGDPPAVRRASGPCPNCGGRVTFSSLPSEGVLFRLQLRCQPVEVRNESADAGGARVWIVSTRDVPAALLKRRFQRSGWRVQRVADCAAAAAKLASGPPHLVVVLEGDGSSAAEARALHASLPRSTPCILVVTAGSQTLSGAIGPGDCEVRIDPLSPGEMRELTRRASEHGESNRDGPSTASRGLNDRPRVLIVDDNEVNRIVASGLVQALGYEVSTVSDGLDAIERCKTAPPDLVLMDVNMPVLNGIDATRRIRALQRLGRIAPFAIVATTAASDPDTADRCLAAGMDGFLSKPLHLNLLQQELRRVTAVRS